MPSETMRAARHLSKAPPAILYHYTDQKGLLGIIESRQLWATKVQYLNDSTEFNLAVEIAKQRLADRRSSYTKPEGINKLIDNIIDRLSSIASVNICTVSFCEHDDLLSQWRGYSHEGGGVSIGFRADALTKAAHKDNGRLGKCIYDNQIQNEIIIELINDVIEIATEISTDIFTEDHKYSEYFNRQLIEWGAFFKSTGFYEEHEWRLVSGIKLYTDPLFKFRPGHSMLTPYYVSQLAPDGWLDEISSVTIGLSPHPSASTQAITGLFYKHGIYSPHRASSSEPNFDIRLSKIPFRNW
jgi:hypothetical protein